MWIVLGGSFPHVSMTISYSSFICQQSRADVQLYNWNPSVGGFRNNGSKMECLIQNRLRQYQTDVVPDWGITTEVVPDWSSIRPRRYKTEAVSDWGDTRMRHYQTEVVPDWGNYHRGGTRLRHYHRGGTRLRHYQTGVVPDWGGTRLRRY